MTRGLLDGLVVSVTGAASGIGRATAAMAVREGAAGLVVSDRDQQALARLVSELRTGGYPGIEPVCGDIASPAVAERITAVAVEHFGRLDAAVNNAGIRGPIAAVADLTDEEFDAVLDVNLRAVHRCMRSQLRQMYAQGSGSIVNVASASVFGASPNLAPYVASKMAVIGLSKVASREAGPRGVRVNVVAPGRTDTPLLATYGAEGTHDAAALVAPIPLRRMGRPQELADAIIYLCSERSSFVTGATLVVDGGRTG